MCLEIRLGRWNLRHSGFSGARPADGLGRGSTSYGSPPVSSSVMRCGRSGAPVRFPPEGALRPGTHAYIERRLYRTSRRASSRSSGRNTHSPWFRFSRRVKETGNHLLHPPQKLAACCCDRVVPSAVSIGAGQLKPAFVTTSRNATHGNARPAGTGARSHPTPEPDL